MKIATHGADPGAAGPHAAAVVIASMLRPTLLDAVRSVYGQALGGPIHVLIGIDVRRGPDTVIERLLAERPSHVAVTICDPGYSTAARNGGLCPSYGGGDLRTALTCLAASRHVAYLDDDNWWAPDHLSSLRAAIDGVGWSFAQRWFVDAATGERLGLDDWTEAEVDRTLPPAGRHGFADTNVTMIDKRRCHEGVVEWSHPDAPSGAGADRALWRWLHAHQPGRATGRATAFYRIEDRHQLAERLARRAPRPAARRRPLAQLIAAIGGAFDPPGAAPPPVAAPMPFAALPAIGTARELLLFGGDAAVAVPLAQAAPAATVVVVDTWRDPPSPDAAAGPPPAHRAFQAAVADARLSGRVIGLPMRWMAAASFLQRVGVAVDLVALDLARAGDPRALLRAAAGILRPGGTILARAVGPEAADALAGFAAVREIDLAPAVGGGWHALPLPAI
ncbi:MAG: hypothetical protein AB7P02_14440 [Alphaproteobacteria bacterium]